jgi:hypothetical protein
MCRKKVMATFRTPQWFEATRGLRNNGLDVLRISQRDVNKEELAQAFGPKSNKNGWRYDYRLSPEAAREVEELYCRVISKNKITNNKLTLQFAWDSFLRVGVLKSIGRPLLHIFILTERRCALQK